MWRFPEFGGGGYIAWRLFANANISALYAPRCKSKDHKGRDCPQYRAKRQKMLNEDGGDEN